MFDSALLKLLRPVRRRLALAIGCEAVSALAGIVPFVAVAELGRTLLAEGEPDRSRIWTIAAIGVGALVVRFGLMLCAAMITHYADTDAQLSIRRAIAARLGRVPLGWFSESNSGLVKKAVSDNVSALHYAIAHVLLEMTSAIVVPVACLGYLLTVDWRMSLVTLLPLAAGVYLYTRALSGYKPKMAEYDRALGRVNSATVEFVEGISVVKTFGRTAKAHGEFSRAADDFATFFLAWVRATTRVSAAAELILSPVVVLTVILGAGTGFVTQGWLPAVDLLPFALLGLAVTASVYPLGQQAFQLRGAGMAAGQIDELLRTPTLPASAQPAQTRGTRVVFDDVSFSYDGRQEAVTGVSAVLEPGTVTALVGSSGAGKSTLAALLPRFHDVTGGSISIGGADLRQIPPDELYRLVGFVFQDVRLLRTSIRDNIALARPDASEGEVQKAAMAARIHERILELPRGYDTVFGDDIQLSGGEMQRISISRALVADAPVLVLDEATAYADPESEAAIQEALAELATGRTLLVIAHRLTTIAGADQILVMSGGRIVERGRHHELLAAEGQYARMHAAHEGASR